MRCEHCWIHYPAKDMTRFTRECGYWKECDHYVCDDCLEAAGWDKDEIDTEVEGE